MIWRIYHLLDPFSGSGDLGPSDQGEDRSIDLENPGGNPTLKSGHLPVEKPFT